MLVTGANGFIGNRLVRRLASNGRSVRAMVRTLEGVRLPDGVPVVQADVTKPETLGAAVTGITVVVHAAALVANLKEPYPGAYQAVNVRGTQSLVEAAQRAKVERFALLSGMDTQPGKVGSYMATRWGMEEAVRQGGIPYVVLQPSVLFGDGAPFVTELAKLARTFSVVPAIGGGGVMFQPIWVEDVVSCLVECLDRTDVLGGTYPVGGAEGRAMGKRRTTVALPVPVARGAAALMTAALSHP
ncbi:MAG: SDR family oxidoreductase, partial [Candidatus Dormibacteria bacterium]